MKHSLVLVFIFFLPQTFSIAQDYPNETYNVGTRYFRWIDTNRLDPYYGGYRIINVQVWYPSDITESNNEYERSSYYSNIEDIWEKLNGWSAEDVALVSSINTISFVNAPVSTQKKSFPLLIFSPTLGGNISLYTYYAEALARNGFIVAGVNHLYESEFVLNEEGEVFPSDLSFHDSLKLLEIPTQITADDYRKEKGKRQKILAEDMIYSLNKLEEVNPEDFDGKIDLKSIGVWGHSIGGAAAIYTSILDDRIKAVLDIDGTPPTVALKGINVPFMFIEDLPDYKNHDGFRKQFIRRSEFCKKVKGGAYRVLIGGADHNSFLDINYYSADNEPVKENALRIISETLDYMKTFFDIYLKGENLVINGKKSDSLEVIKF
ncbi:MAG: hypothetical protein KDC73_06250 [Ignavibacteriae bacterium]|nr:hypothetical protein [Ignavibacteriota bacterium]MCB9243670.1 hypothetical protein [Ignavibacteriales bacterium]